MQQYPLRKKVSCESRGGLSDSSLCIFKQDLQYAKPSQDMILYNLILLHVLYVTMLITIGWFIAHKQHGLQHISAICGKHLKTLP